MDTKGSLTEKCLISRNPELLFSVIDDEVIVLSIKDEEYLNLNPEGSSIWNKIKDPLSFGKLIDLLMEEFDIDRNTCWEETAVFLEDMKKRDIVRIVYE